MKSTVVKRKASPIHLDLSEKRIRTTDETQFTKNELDNDDSEADSESYIDNNSNDDDDRSVETSFSIFSPKLKNPSSDLRLIKCTYDGCTKTFNRPSRLTAHLRSHTNERPFVCSFENCDKSYLQEKHLQHHIKSVHTHERAYHCEWEGCDKSFLTSTRLKRHHEVHRGRDRFRCTEYPPCNKFFRKHQTLQRHIRSDHLQISPFPCTNVDPLTGETCNAGFDGSTGLRQHQERAHGNSKYLCTECTVTGSFNSDGTPIHPGFASYSKLQTHIRKEHANCMFCNIKCRSHRELLSHIDTQHSGKSLNERQQYFCNEPGCNKKFTTRYNLNAHIRAIHTASRYICGTFEVSDLSELQGWSCKNGCGNDFSSKKNLINHIRTAHLDLSSNNKCRSNVH